MEFYALRELNGGGGPGTAISQRDVATKQAYANTLARVAKEHGITGDAAAGIPALYKSHQATLTQLQKTAAMTKTYEQTALKNLDIAEEMAKKYGRTAWPAANRFQNWFSENVDNNPNYTALENSIYTAAREYAKVTGGGAMSAQALTDSASKEAQKLINAGQSPEQFLAATSIMRRDMHNVPASFDAEIEAERGLLGSLINSTQARGPVNPAGGAPLAAPATGAKVKVRNKATGKTGTMSETSFNAHSDQYERVQ
jgi:uncharacterized protein